MSSLLSKLGGSLNNGSYSGPLGSAMKSIFFSSNNINKNTILLARFNYDIIDYSPSKLNLISNGSNVQFSALSNFGDGSVFFGSSSFVSVPNTPILGLGRDNFTIQMWAYKSSALTDWNGLFELGTGTNPYQNGLMIRLQSTNNDPLYIAGTMYAWNPAANFPLNRWNHIALVREGNIFNLYVNGRSVISPITNAANLGSSSILYIGNTIHSNGSQTLNGFIDGFMITKDVLYTSNFGVPTRPS